MTIVSSGPISIQDVYNEFGPSAVAGTGFATTPHSLDEFYSLGNKTSYFTGRSVTSTPNTSTIALNAFYGKSRDLQFNVIGAKSNWVDGYPASFTFSNLGFAPGGFLNRWYIVFLTRPYASGYPSPTISFDGAAAVSPNHTAAFNWIRTTTAKGTTTTTTGPIGAGVSVWLHKKNTGSSMTITLGGTATQYQMVVFEVYTTHNMTSANKTFYAGTGTSVSFSIAPVVGSIFIQSATNDENSAVNLLGEWANLSYGTETATGTFYTSGPQGNGFYYHQQLRDGSFSRRSVWSMTAATFFENTTARTFTMQDSRGRTFEDQQVSAALYIRP